MCDMVAHTLTTNISVPTQRSDEISAHQGRRASADRFDRLLT
jgi:hypothetical protein